MMFWYRAHANKMFRRSFPSFQSRHRGRGLWNIFRLESNQVYIKHCWPMVLFEENLACFTVVLNTWSSANRFCKEWVTTKLLSRPRVEQWVWPGTDQYNVADSLPHLCFNVADPLPHWCGWSRQSRRHHVSAPRHHGPHHHTQAGPPVREVNCQQ